ncbi:hypothetical protein ACJ41O_011862 [Fusarium nematophilum]
MKPHHLVLGALVSGFTEARTLPDYVNHSLNSSSGLGWKTCDFDFPKSLKDQITYPADCATLKVPLDYTSLSTGRTIKLQLFRAKATKQPVKGSVLFNPGGPGESGVESLIGFGPKFVELLGGHYNIIGFDPRGTGRTIPFKCDTEAQQPNSTDASKRDLPGRSDNSFPPGNPWPYIKKEGWEEANTYADNCFKSNQEYGPYIGTASVARDMLSIVDALNEDGKLRYWGISYGTALGQVFATMFPDRVGRMLLDSNLFADDYLTVSSSISFWDSENAFDKFLDECVEAGPSLCKLANYSGPSTEPEDIKTAVKVLFDELLNSPTLPAGLDTKDFPQGGADLERTLKSVILQQLYSPSTYGKLTNVVANALEGNWEEALIPSNDDAAAAASSGSDEEEEDPWNHGSDDALKGITCADSSFRVETPEDLYSLTQLTLAYGSFSEADLPTRCARWRFDAVEKVNTNDMRSVKTSFPILFVNGPYDPVTPLAGAWSASVRFRESRVLIHEGVGHSFLQHPSNCTNEAVSRYFNYGEMPEVGTTCKPNLSAFEHIQSKQG